MNTSLSPETATPPAEDGAMTAPAGLAVSPTGSKPLVGDAGEMVGSEAPPRPRTDLWATYSPEDNKLRLSSRGRLDTETYQRVKAAGFIWAPKQDVFVAPMWTPAREDLLLELCGEIGDEDTSLVERAEQRSERFDTYSENRAADAEAAKRAVSALADNIPLGQPILVGHHSERKARRDAERIRTGMHKAVRLWDTSQYWERRAAACLQHATYKERPDVRHRRIKTLEADLRRQARRLEESERFTKLWQREGLTLRHALAIANYDRGASLWSELTDGKITVEAAAAAALSQHAATEAHARRWLDHLNHRLVYERALLGEAGGIAAERFNIEVGGKVLIDRAWLFVQRVTRKDGRIVSVTPLGSYRRSIEEVHDYQPPEPGIAERVKTATKLPPLCNFPGEGFVVTTKAEWNRHWKQIQRAEATDEFGAYRYRVAGAGAGNHGQVSLTEVKHTWGKNAQVYLTDVKRTDRPRRDDIAQTDVNALPSAGPGARPRIPAPRRKLDPAVEAMRGQLRQGVQVVSAPQLFITPTPLAAQMVELAELTPSNRVLEPSAGTGALVQAIRGAGRAGAVTAVEINRELVEHLRAQDVDVRLGDFLELADELGQFDRVLMNPPFAGGQDVQHITRAFDLLRPGGRLVGICADGPRQTKALRPLVQRCSGLWQPLPAGTFAGTDVRAVLLTLTK
jgi:phospholipid N-methyltransferase